MRQKSQTLAELLDRLGPLVVDWQDDTARRVISVIESLPSKPTYDKEDVRCLLAEDFKDGILVCRTFLGLSDDDMDSALKEHAGGSGIKRFSADPDRFLDALVELGLLEQMDSTVNRELRWSDILVERLRSGRGSAIKGLTRGRNVEMHVQEIVERVFDGFDIRCNFTGARGQVAKCDFAIPSKESPRIVIEAKGYGATGSKMTDIIGDVEKIISAKRADTAFLLFTDGLTWRRRQSDLRKLVDYQNQGDITRIYTFSMGSLLEEDLRQLKGEYDL